MSKIRAKEASSDFTRTSDLPLLFRGRARCTVLGHISGKCWPSLTADPKTTRTLLRTWLQLHAGYPPEGAGTPHVDGPRKFGRLPSRQSRGLSLLTSWGSERAPHVGHKDVIPDSSKESVYSKQLKKSVILSLRALSGSRRLHLVKAHRKSQLVQGAREPGACSSAAPSSAEEPAYASEHRNPRATP